MSIELYSKRKTKEGLIEVIFVYDHMPKELKQQIIYIWEDSIGDEKNYHKIEVRSFYENAVKLLACELGVRTLYKDSGFSKTRYLDELNNYFLKEDRIDKCLDVIELVFSMLNYYYKKNREETKAIEAIKILNKRLKEHNLGYEFIDDKVLRTDSAYIHQEAVKPALLQIKSLGFEGVEDEFYQAHKHFLSGNHKGALQEANKAFESTMKSILNSLNHPYDEKDTVYKLVEHCVSANLFSSYHSNYLNHLIGLLKSGINTIRNNDAGHGQGISIKDVNANLVSYGLHQTASVIIFLCKCFDIKKNQP